MSDVFEAIAKSSGPQKKDKKDIPGDTLFVREMLRSAEATTSKVQTTAGHASETVFSEGDLDSMAELIPENLMRGLKEKLNFTRLSAIQKSALEPFSKGHNLFIKAQTGSGKTVAYLLPLLKDLVLNYNIKREHGSYAIILAPTRELCLQIEDTLDRLAFKYPYIVRSAFTGGENRDKEKQRIRKGVTIFVATPGRALDHLQNTASMKLDHLKYLVFDEADRLLDLGFKQQMEKILEFVNDKVEKTQNILVSATKGQELALFANQLLGHDHKTISATEKIANEVDETEKFRLPETLKQSFVIVPAKVRFASLCFALAAHLGLNESARIIVFCSTQDEALFLTETLRTTELFKNTVTLNLFGSMDQNQRKTAFQRFKDESPSILFTTDVAARGLDFPDVSLILQFDAPVDVESYVHRAGRTARIGSSGEAILFLQETEADFITALSEKGIGLHAIAFDRLLEGASDFFKQFDATMGLKTGISSLDRASKLHNHVKTIVQSTPRLNTLGIRAFQSWIQGYRVRSKEYRHIFNLRNLNQGHIAESFLLKETPQQLAVMRTERIDDIPLRQFEKDAKIKEAKQAKREEWLKVVAKHVSRKEARLPSKVNSSQQRDNRMVGGLESANAVARKGKKFRARKMSVFDDEAPKSKARK